MKRFIYVCMVFSLITIFLSTFAEAKTYVLRDKLTGEPAGTASIADKYINDWAKDYILTDEGEEFRGKHGWEMKYENGNVRHATKAEKDAYKAQKEAEQEARKIQEFLAYFENEEIKDKIKEIKNQ